VLRYQTAADAIEHYAEAVSENPDRLISLYWLPDSAIKNIKRDL